MRETLILIVAILVVFSTIGHSRAAGEADEGRDRHQGLVLHVALGQTSFLPYEPIWFFAQVENLGNEPARYTMSHISVFAVADSEGVLLPYRETSAYPENRPLLPPDSASPRIITVITDRCGEGVGDLDRLLPPGRYSFFNRYFVGDTVGFVIREPADDEERRVVELFREARTAEGAHSYESAYASYKRIWNDYPASPLALPALRKMILICHLFPDADTVEYRGYYCQLLLRYPKSPFVLSVLTHDFQADWCSDAEKGSVLSNLDIVIETFSGTYLEQLAHELRDRLQAAGKEGSNENSR